MLKYPLNISRRLPAVYLNLVANIEVNQRLRDFEAKLSGISASSVNISDATLALLACRPDDLSVLAEETLQPMLCVKGATAPLKHVYRCRNTSLPIDCRFKTELSLRFQGEYV